MAGHRVAVFAPSVWVSVTVEAGHDDRDDIHVHAAGQGIWIARMLRELGDDPLVCAPVGGEGGEALKGLTRNWGIQLRPVITDAWTPVRVIDRRHGEREEVARTRSPVLNRHETDELYDVVLQSALESGCCVITGQLPDERLPTAFFHRLGADLAEAGVASVGDLHGVELSALLEGGPLDVLKVSDTDLAADGWLSGPDVGEADIVAVTRELAARVRMVVVSRAGRPTIVHGPGGLYRVTGPELATVDATGSGDSMTAVIVAGRLDGLDDETLVRRAWAAGAANVTRHGLGGAPSGLIDGLSDRVEIEHLESP